VASGKSSVNAEKAEEVIREMLSQKTSEI